MIGVNPGGVLVEVAGANGSISLRHLSLDTCNQAELGMNLQSRHTIYDFHPFAEQPVAPVDIGLLVKACLQFNHGCHALAITGGIHQSVDDARISCQPVQCDMDRCDERINRGLPEEINEVIERMVREVEHYIPLPDNREYAFTVMQGRMPHRWQLRVVETFAFNLDELHEILEVVVPVAGHYHVF